MFYTRASFVVLDYNSSGITSSGEPIISTLRLLWLGCSCYGSRGHKVSQWDSIRIQRQEYIVQSHLHFKHLSDTPPKTFLLSIYHSPYRLEQWLLNIWSLCSLKGKGGCAQVCIQSGYNGFHYMLYAQYITNSHIFANIRLNSQPLS